MAVDTTVAIRGFADLSTFPYTVSLGVAFRDVDLFRHVNNSVYFSWFENARVNFLLDIFGLSHPHELPVTVASTECRYIKPLAWREDLSLGAGITKVGTKSFEIAYVVYERTKGLCAAGKSAQVFFDHSQQMSMEIPAHLKSILYSKQVRGVNGG